MAKNLEISVLLDYYGQMLTEKQREVARLYYNEDLSLADFQKKLVHRGNSAVTLGKSFCFNYCF